MFKMQCNELAGWPRDKQREPRGRENYLLAISVGISRMRVICGTYGVGANDRPRNNAVMFYTE